MLNKCFFMGRLAADPELKMTTSGTPCCTFRLAVDRDCKEKDESRSTDWINLVAWKGLAKFIYRFFKKGNMVVIVCSARVRTYERNGEKRSIVEFVVRDACFAEKKASEGLLENNEIQGKEDLDNISLPWEN